MDVARARRRWMREQGLFDPARLVFIDETWTNTSMVRPRGRCERGKRLLGYAPLGNWKMLTFIAGLRNRGMIAPFVLEGAMNGAMCSSLTSDNVLYRNSDAMTSSPWTMFRFTKLRAWSRRLER